MPGDARFVSWLAIAWLVWWFPPARGFMSHEFSSTRYFTDKGILPPLNCLGVPLNQTYQDDTIPYTDTSSRLCYEGSSVPVTYTNDPTSVYRWLSDHLPYQGCIIGFDIEVSNLAVYYTFFNVCKSTMTEVDGARNEKGQ